MSEEFTYVWRTDEQRYVQVADARFGNQYGVRARRAGGGAAPRSGKAELPPARVATLCLGDARTRARAADAAKRIGCDPKTPARAVARSRSASSARPSRWCSSAARSRPRRRATSSSSPPTARAPTRSSSAPPTRCPRAGPRRSPSRLAGAHAGAVVRALAARARRAARPTSAARRCRPYIEWKELKQDVRLYGSRCEACGLVQYPQARVCIGCQARGPHGGRQARARRGTVFTFTIDNLAQVAEHPLPMVVVDLDGGGRVYLQGTDCAEGEIAVGTRVRAHVPPAARGGRQPQLLLEGTAGMKDQVAVIGVGCTKFGERFDRGYEELICDAAFEAYDDAGIDPAEIEAGYLGTYLPGPGGGKSAVVARRRAPPLRPADHAGRELLRHRHRRLPQRLPRRSPRASHDVVLVLGAEKLKDRGGRGIPRLGHPLLGARQHGARASSRSPPTATCTPSASAARRSPRWR